MEDWSRPDFTRETPRRGWDPARKLMASLRAYQQAVEAGGLFGKIASKVHVIRHRFWSVVTGADIPLNSNIEGGLLLPHPNGVVVHPDSEVGANCLFFQQVTLAGVCKLGYHVDVGAGAKIIGPVTIGDNVRIGANAVVTRDVPSNTTVAGIPARPIETKQQTETSESLENVFDPEPATH